MLPLGTPHPCLCPDCQSPMLLTETYGKLVYRCQQYPHCHNEIAATIHGEPGRDPVSRSVRAARKLAHYTFDRLWKPRDKSSYALMTKEQAYAWLYSIFGRELHIADMTESECGIVIQQGQKYLKGRNNVRMS